MEHNRLRSDLRHCLASRLFRAGFALWTLLVGLSLFYSYNSVQQAAFDGARLWALASFEKDVVMRHWGAEHGGVYVPVTPQTPPNPYLQGIPEREITTPSGRLLTLVNPAYMTRQIYEISALRGETRGHITSLNPIRPANKADQWEQEALQSFERGERERIAVIAEAGKRYLRFMRPFITEKPCMKCHEAQGFKVGDVRGGISITLPMEPYLAIAAAQTSIVSSMHAGVWFFGVIVLVHYTNGRKKREAERRHSEELLRMNERRLNLIYNNISDLVMLVRCEQGAFIILSANRAFYDTFTHFGVPLDEKLLAGRTLPEFLDSLGCNAATRNEELHRWHGVIAQREPLTWHQTFALPADTMHTHITLSPVIDNRGACSHLLWSCRNVTARVKVQETLFKAEENYMRLFNAMADGFALVRLVRDADGKVIDYIYIDVNPAVEGILGVPRSALIGSSARRLFPDMDDEWLISIAADHAGGVLSVEGYARHLGKYLKRQIYSPKPDQRAIIFSDITVQKQIERENRALAEQLMQSQKMEAIGQLAGGIAHDFNNILTSIISNAFVMKKRLSEEDPSYLFVEEIFSEAGRAASLTKGMLAFSRKQAMHLGPVLINELMERMSAMLKRIIGEDILIRLDLCEQDASALADAGQLEQVLMNLATNARDAMPSGGVLVLQTDVVDVDHAFVEKHGFGETRRYAVLRVQDSGQGMDEQTRARIFEPFFTTKDVGKGTGLGLAMAYGIVKQHRGHIEVESLPGEGSTFSVYLPIAGAPGSQGEAAEPLVIPRGKETVLLAEDEESVRRGMRKMLEDAGYAVIEAGNGEESLNLYRLNRGRIHLTILDVIMPRMSGEAVYQEIVSIDPDAKVMFLSGYSGDIVSDRVADGIRIIEKPCIPSVFLGAVRDALDAGGSVR